jgi:hypothetical protein
MSILGFHISPIALGAIIALLISAAVRALPDPEPMGSKFYAWFFKFTHFVLSNYDKTWPGLKLLLCALLICCVLPSPAQAQMPSTSVLAGNGFYIGGVVNNDASHNFKVSAQYEKRVLGAQDAVGTIYTVTNYDMMGLKKALSGSGLTYTATQSAEVIIAKTSKVVSILARGSVGVTGTPGEATGLAADGMGGIKISAGAFAAKLYLGAFKNTLTPINVEGRAYVGIRF